MAQTHTRTRFTETSGESFGAATPVEAFARAAIFTGLLTLNGL